MLAIASSMQTPTQAESCVLHQADHTVAERVSAFTRQYLGNAGGRQHSSELECLAVVCAVRQFSQYLYEQNFIAITNNFVHLPLPSKQDLTSKLTRWTIHLKEYTFPIHHRSGAAHFDDD